MKKITVIAVLSALCLSACGKKEKEVVEELMEETIVEKTVETEAIEETNETEILEEEKVDENAPISMGDGSYDLTGIDGHIGTDYYNGEYERVVNIDEFGGKDGYLQMLEDERERFRRERVSGETYVVGVPLRDAQYYYDLIDKFEKEGYEVVHYYTETEEPHLIQFHLDEFYVSHLLWDEDKQEYVLSEEDAKVYEELISLEEELEWISRGDRGFEIIE